MPPVRTKSKLKMAIFKYKGQGYKVIESGVIWKGFCVACKA